MFLDPAKLLVILIVGLVVLGPDKLPAVARQMGAAWGQLRQFREKLESEVRDTFPDLPSSQQVAQAVRSPLAFLDQLADAHEREQKEVGRNGSGENEVERDDGSTALKPTLPAAPTVPERGPSVETSPDPSSARERAASGRERAAISNGTGDGERHQSSSLGRTRPWRGQLPGEPLVVPDDPSMN